MKFSQSSLLVLRLFVAILCAVWSMNRGPQLGHEGGSDGLACFGEYFHSSRTMLTLLAIDNARFECKTSGEAGGGSLI